MRNLDEYLERYKMFVHLVFKELEPRTIAHTRLSRKTTDYEKGLLKELS